MPLLFIFNLNAYLLNVLDGSTWMEIIAKSPFCFRDAKEVKAVGPNESASKAEITDDPFFKLLFSPNTVLPEAEK